MSPERRLVLGMRLAGTPLMVTAASCISFGFFSTATLSLAIFCDSESRTKADVDLLRGLESLECDATVVEEGFGTMLVIDKMCKNGHKNGYSLLL